MKISKHYSFHSYILFQANFFSKYSLYFEISILKFKKKKIEIFVNMGPCGVKIAKHYFSYCYESFSTKLCLNVACDSRHKSYQTIGI